jgi:hypothetical protein
MIWLCRRFDFGYDVRSAAPDQPKPGQIGLNTGPKAECEMATAPRQREVFLNEGRVFIQCPRLMTDGELADALAQYVGTVRAKPLHSKVPLEAPKKRGEPNEERRKG